MSEREIAVMFALQAAIEVEVLRGGASRQLAVLDEAWTLAGYAPGSYADLIYLTKRDDVLNIVELARRNRRRLALRQLAHGVLIALRLLADAGVFTDKNARDAQLGLWLEHQKKAIA